MTRLVTLTLAPVLATLAWTPAFGAAVRQLDLFRGYSGDPGTIVAVIDANGPVQSMELNGVPIPPETTATCPVLWWRTWKTIAAGKPLTVIEAKLSRRLRRLNRFSVALGDGTRVSRPFDAEGTPRRLIRYGLGEDRRRLALFFRGCGDRWKPDNVFLDGRDVTDRCSVVNLHGVAARPPVSAVTMDLPAPLAQGTRHVVVVGSGGRFDLLQFRAVLPFALTVEFGPSAGTHDVVLDDRSSKRPTTRPSPMRASGTRPAPGSLVDGSRPDGYPGLVLLAECVMHNYETLHVAADKAAKAYAALLASDGAEAGHVYACRADQRRGASLFAPLGDAVSLYPALDVAGAAGPAEHIFPASVRRRIGWAVRAAGPTPVLTLSMAAGPNEPTFVGRSPNEAELRLSTYAALGAGALGVCYYNKAALYGAQGLTVEGEAVRRLNLELRQLRPILGVACPVSRSFDPDTRVEAAWLYSAAGSLVCILINHNLDRTPRQFKKINPVSNLSVQYTLPLDAGVTAVRRIAQESLGNELPYAFTPDKRELRFTVPELADATALVVDLEP